MLNNNYKMNEKGSQEYQSMDPEYVTGKLIVIFWSFFWDDFIVWFLHRLKNLNMGELLMTIKDILAICKCRYCIEWLL